MNSASHTEKRPQALGESYIRSLRRPLAVRRGIHPRSNEFGLSYRKAPSGAGGIIYPVAEATSRCQTRDSSPRHDDVSFPNGPATRPHDDVSFPNGPVTRPHDEVTFPNGPATRPHDEVTFPNGSATRPNDEVTFPNGPATRPHDEVTFLNGFTVTLYVSKEKLTWQLHRSTNNWPPPNWP